MIRLQAMKWLFESTIRVTSCWLMLFVCFVGWYKLWVYIFLSTYICSAFWYNLFLKVSCFCLQYDDIWYFSIFRDHFLALVCYKHIGYIYIKFAWFNSFQTDHQTGFMHFLVVLIGSFCYHIDRNVTRFPTFEALSIYISSEPETTA